MEFEGLEELFNEAAADEEALSIAGGVEGEAVLSEAEIDQAAVESFRQEALASPQAWKDYILTGLKNAWGKVTLANLANVILVGTGGVMIYEFIEKHTKVAEDGGKKIKLSAAIDGTRQTLVDQYQNTIHAVAIKKKNDTDTWNALDPNIQRVIESEIAMDGETYWLTVGQTLMEKLAELPIYDPT